MPKNSPSRDRASKFRSPRPLFLAFGDLAFRPVDPSAPSGLQIADLWGDHRKGAFGALVKLPPGFAAPLHTHTHDWRIVVVSGTYIQAGDGEPEVRLGPGSCVLQPGGDYRHTTRCDPSSECVFFVESEGPYDLIPVRSSHGRAPRKHRDPRPHAKRATPVRRAQRQR